jgi:predicted membrane protein
MDSEKSRIPSSRLVLGAVAIILGILFTLNNLGIIEAGDYLHFWPVALMAFGLAVFLESSKIPGRFGGGIVMLAGTLMMLNNLGIVRFRLHDWWPLLLVLIGISIIWRGFDRARYANLDPSSTVSGIAILGGIERTCSSPDFRGGELTALLGGCKVDLRKADMKVGEAVIQTFAFWGGIEIKVPEDWRVSVEAFPILGGFDEKTQAPKEGPMKVLIVKGFAIMGGVEIRN